MHFHLPRRHRRPLFFPAGLLALAGLLWLGCVALGPWWERLKRPTVLQLTMPPIPVSDTTSIYKGISLSTHSLREPLPLFYSQLSTLYSWKNIQFNGNHAHDSLAALSILQTIQIMRDDTIPNCGIRVRFTPEVKYKGWIKLIDLMLISKQKKYLFDTYHGPFTLYVFVDEYSPKPKPKLVEPIAPVFLCGTNDYILPLPSPRLNISRWELLQYPEWRWPIALLAVIAALSSWRIFRAWRVG